MFKRRINKEMLKHDYPLYFALAYFIEIKRAKFIKVSLMGSDEILHVIVNHDDLYFDALDSYRSLRDSIPNADDVPKLDLIFESINYDQIVKYILDTHHMFDNELFMDIREYVRNNYHLPSKK